MICGSSARLRSFNALLKLEVVVLLQLVEAFYYNLREEGSKSFFQSIFLGGNLIIGEIVEEL